MRLIEHETNKDWDLVHFRYLDAIHFEGLETNCVTLACMNMEHNPDLKLADGSLVREQVYFYTAWGHNWNQSALGSINDGTVYICDEQWLMNQQSKPVHMLQNDVTKVVGSEELDTVEQWLLSSDWQLTVVGFSTAGYYEKSWFYIRAGEVFVFQERENSVRL